MSSNDVIRRGNADLGRRLARNGEKGHRCRDRQSGCRPAEAPRESENHAERNAERALQELVSAHRVEPMSRYEQSSAH